jgi:signal transduction histidine kinase/ActR/RegA family two-component response regulator
LYVSTTPLFDESGQVERIISVAFDITARMRVEEQLVRTREDALNLSRAKESFLSVMSHEMRTPLNAVIGMSRLLAEEEHLKQQEEHLGILQFSAENLLTLINDLLDYTKIETGNMVLESAPVNLDSLASKTIQSLMPKAREQGIALAYEVDPHVPAFVYADHTRLYQILINLLGNAVKFTSKGFVKLKIAEVGEEDEKALIRFEVTDTGIGIAADKLTTIFDPYKQAGSDITRKFGGTGLGLAITKKLIELYGSEISVSSKLNEGTTFSFTLELKKARLSDIKTASKMVEESLSGHILVVDDSAVNRLVAQKILKRWKLDVDVAEDGVEALEKIERNDYDLVLMDIHMPVMDGLEAVKAIRSRTESKYQLLPIIALTGSIVANEDATIKDAGMNDYVLKPFDPPFLYSKIKALLPKQEETAIN